jgi:hypothetical protein
MIKKQPATEPIEPQGPYYLVTAREFMSTLASPDFQATLYPGNSCVLNQSQWLTFSTIPLGSFSYQEIDEADYTTYAALQGSLGFKL